MTPERFDTLASAYGGDLRRWPEAERAAAEAFARRPEAQAALARERRLDGLLDRAAAPKATPQLVARLAAAPRRERIGFLAQAAGLAAAVVLGLFVGWSAPNDPSVEDAWDAVLLGDWDEG